MSVKFSTIPYYHTQYYILFVDKEQTNGRSLNVCVSHCFLGNIVNLTVSLLVVLNNRCIGHLSVYFQFCFEASCSTTVSSHLSLHDRWRIISLNFDQGHNLHEIARRIPCSIQTVYNILYLFQEANDVTERDRPGRLQILNNDRVNTLRQLLYRYPTDTSSSIADQSSNNSKLSVIIWFSSCSCTKLTINYYKTCVPTMNEHSF
ncbi:hypothetical protein I4U23_027373 [Adineta vaga]|nr:hypothetical protein I4U23_027373 [Adineta vaga]